MVFTRSRRNPPGLFCNRLQSIHKIKTFSVKHKMCQSTRKTTDTSLTREESGPVVLLWFKKDLRIDDHPGLAYAAENNATIVPIFVFDPKVYDSLIRSEDMAVSLVEALKSLSDRLKHKYGATMLFKIGDWDIWIPQLFKKYHCTSVSTEDECETVWREALEGAISALMVDCDGREDAEIFRWRARLFDGPYSDRYEGMCYSFRVRDDVV